MNNFCYVIMSTKYDQCYVIMRLKLDHCYVIMCMKNKRCYVINPKRKHDFYFENIFKPKILSDIY